MVKQPFSLFGQPLPMLICGYPFIDSHIRQSIRSFLSIDVLSHSYIYGFFSAHSSIHSFIIAARLTGRWYRCHDGVTVALHVLSPLPFLPSKGKIKYPHFQTIQICVFEQQLPLPQRFVADSDCSFTRLSIYSFIPRFYFYDELSIRFWIHYNGTGAIMT